MARPLTLRSAQELLACFDVADDPLTNSFLLEILASGAAPQEEVDLLSQLSAQAVDDQAPGSKRRSKKKKPKSRSKRKGTKTEASPFFAEASDKAEGENDVLEDSQSTKLVAVFTTTTVLNAQPDASRQETAVHVAEKKFKSMTGDTNEDPFISYKDQVYRDKDTIEISHTSPETSSRPVSPAYSSSSSSSSSSSPEVSPCTNQWTPRTKRQTTSHFFRSPSRTTQKNDTGHDEPTTPKHTPRRGAVSGLPFARLAADRFGLVQEELARDPFWLLVALVFLVRVAGRVSLPVFWRIKAAYPTPAALAAADPCALVAAIRHLGMATVRCATIQRYARLWLQRPPCEGVCTTVKNYPQPPEDAEDAEDTIRARDSAWEIGHLTQGAYFVDSWRIFCRDELLGLSTDWQGRGADASFQPEWMRVLPRDKELRACLRWMWMREGWDWDPRTGERTVLREELRQAVDEGRVGYDVHGALQIVTPEDG